MQCTMRPTLSLWASEMPLNASAEAKATAEQTISVLQGGHYSWQKGWLKRIPGIYARLLNYLVPYTKTVIAAMVGAGSFDCSGSFAGRLDFWKLLSSAKSLSAGAAQDPL